MSEFPLRLPVKRRLFQRNRNGTAAILFECRAPVRARVVSGKKTIGTWLRSTRCCLCRLITGPKRRGWDRKRNRSGFCESRTSERVGDVGMTEIG